MVLRRVLVLAGQDRLGVNTCLGGVGVGAAQLWASVELVALTVVLRLRLQSLST